MSRDENPTVRGVMSGALKDVGAKPWTSFADSRPKTILSAKRGDSIASVCYYGFLSYDELRL